MELVLLSFRHHNRCSLYLVFDILYSKLYAINLGLVLLDVVHTPDPDPVDVDHVLILDLVHDLVLVVKVQEDIQNQPVVQDHKVIV